MLRDLLAQKVSHALASVRAEPWPVVDIQDAKSPEFGDFTTNIAMVAAKGFATNPRALGEAIAAELAKIPGITRAEVAGPGFINIWLDPSEVASRVQEILDQGDNFGQVASETPQRINIEFVSVNPNGPITIGSGRGAAYGSALCNVLEAAGHTVHREYYINDGVNSEQMRLFTESVRALALDEALPEGGYKGDYVETVARYISFMHGAGVDSKEFFDSLPDLFRRHMLLTASSRLVGRRFSSLDSMNKFLEWIFEAPDESAMKNAATTGQYLFLSRSVPLLEEAEFRFAGRLMVAAGLWFEHTVKGMILPRYVKAHRILAIEKELQSQSTEGFSAEEMLVYSVARGFAAVKNNEFSEARFSSEPGDYRLRIREKGLTELQVEVQERMLELQRYALTAFGVEFDTWFSEQGLHDAGMVEAEIDHLESSGVADDAPHRIKLKLAKGGKWEDVEIEAQVSDEDDAEGAGRTLWLRSTKFGDDQDRVLRRRDGRLTYIASDVAYHKDKFNRPANADRLITILGPDHHGYIGRLRAVVAAMLVAEGLVPAVDSGEPLTELEAKVYKSSAERDTCAKATALAEQKLEVQIFQLVRFLKDGKPAPMRKRDGNIYALSDLMREIGSHLKPDRDEAEQLETGSDVARFFYLMRSHDTTFDFDLDLAQRESDENPVFYVQYAHARICSVLAKAAEQGLKPDVSRLDALKEQRELTLIKKVDDLPFELLRASQDYGVHRLATYAQELAKSYHSFYDVCRVIQPEQPELTGARLALCQATALGLRRCLALLGISAPERM